MWLDDYRTALYRLFDAADTLLYIGISHQPEVRFAQHSKLKEWWPRVVRREVEWFDDRPTAAKAEEEAIRAEDPEHNGTYSPRRSRKSIRHVVAADGVEEISLTLARSKLTSLVRKAEAGTPVVLLNHGRRHAVIVSPSKYREIAENRRIVEALQRLPDLLDTEGNGDAKETARVLREALAVAKGRALGSH
ncbi:type II toxin-antitoxin system prevent-host-death family antitoxin [Streptomyces sp. enrichment culture]|uniref:type II toxin-antitoxin system prevent-host-death family antitoxin n=1 Tax=Streptomyces sp. enrichment culture TaxID=1795815 RepID=UPI003F56C8CE